MFILIAFDDHVQSFSHVRPSEINPCLVASTGAQFASGGSGAVQGRPQPTELVILLVWRVLVVHFDPYPNWLVVEPPL